ncbi:alpha/beta hydrolase [Nonomuraea sp. NPDC000554]|uniref:alpha/beta fold hydrolase n=1 Tax=Nonomuraea sp. NPDC000554 TaxID=3154259 RepID=UPI00332CD190
MYANPKGGRGGYVARDGAVITAWETPNVHSISPDALAEEILAAYLYRGRPVAFCCAGAGLRLADARWKRPDTVGAITDSGICMLVHDRPGYGGSTRQPRRAVADVVADVRVLVDTQGWDRFAVAGVSGGGPHALACAALLSDRVTRCAVSACIAPPLVEGPEPSPDEEDPRRNLISWLAAQGEHRLRPRIEEAAHQIMASIQRGGPEVIPDPDAPGTDSVAVGPAKDSPASMARLTATFVDSHEGWVDDNIAFAADWGFTLPSIGVPVSLWYGTKDDRSRKQAAYLAAAIKTADCHEYVGGHLQNDLAHRRMLAWLQG